MKRHYGKILAFMILFSMIFGLPGVSFAAETGESVETGETISEDEAEGGTSISEDISGGVDDNSAEMGELSGNTAEGSVSDDECIEKDPLTGLSEESASAITLPTSYSNYTLGSRVTENIPVSGLTKWYKLSLDQTRIMMLSLTSTKYPHLYIYDSNGEQVRGFDGRGNYYLGLLKGSYYIKLITSSLNETYDPSVDTSSFCITAQQVDNHYQSFVEDYEDPASLNDTKATADEIRPDNVYHGIVCANNKRDWYKLTVSEDNTYIQLSQSDYYDYDGEITIYNDSDSVIARQNDADAMTVRLLSRGTYYIMASRFNADNNIYGITSYKIAIGKDAKRNEHVTLYMPDDGTEYTLNERKTVHLTGNNNTTQYKLNLFDRAHILKVNVTATNNAYPYLYIGDIYGRYLETQQGAGTMYIGLTEGAYAIRLYCNSPGNDVSFCLTTIDPDNNNPSIREDYRDSRTRNNTDLDASEFQKNVGEVIDIRGILGRNNIRDCYRFTVSCPSVFSVSQKDYRSYGATMTLKDKNGNRILYQSDENGSKQCTIQKGIYYLYAERFNWQNNDYGVTSYRVTLSDAPGVDTCTVTYDGNGAESGTVPEAQRYIKGENVSVKGFGDLKKTGLVFKGWCENRDGTGKLYSEDDIYENIQKDLTLYAVWMEPHYINERVKSVINGKGYGTYSFKLVSDDNKVLKNTGISYYFTDGSGNRLPENFVASSDENGLITIRTKTYDNLSSLSASPVTDRVSANLVYKPDGSRNVLSNTSVIFDITVEPLSFSQEWTMGTKASVEAGIGEGVGLTLGPLEAKASVAEAEASAEVGTTMDLKHEYVSGKRNLEIGQAFNTKIGINGSVGPKADVEAGVHVDAALATAEAGMKLGQMMRLAEKINDYRASAQDMKDVGRFLLATEAVGTGNAFLVGLITLIDKSPFNNVACGTDITAEAGVNVGSVKVYDVNKAGGDNTLAEGSLLSGGYNSVYSNEASIDVSKDAASSKKSMKKESALDVKALSASTSITPAGKCEVGVYKREFLPKNYSLTAEYDGGKKLTVRELSGLGITQKPAQAGNWFYAEFENMDIDQEEYDVLEYKGENLERLCSNISPIDSFVNGNSLFILDSVFSDINEYVQKSGVDAEYSKEISETEKYGYDLNLGLMLELAVKAGVGYKGTEQTTYVRERGIYKSFKTNEDEFYNGLVVPTAVNDVNISQYELKFSDLVSEAANTVIAEAKKYIKKVVTSVKEEAKEAFCSAKAILSEGFNKNWKIVIEAVKDGNLTASTESLKHTAADQLDCELVSYTISTHGDHTDVSDGMNLMAAGDHLGGSAVTLGSPYDVYVTEEDGQTEVVDFSEAPLTITLEYSDAMLEAAGLTSDNEDNIEIFRYDENSCDYISVGGKVDKAANSVTVDGITSHGQFILAVQGKDPENGSKPKPDDGNKPVEKEDEVEPGDLPEGRTAPEGIWVGGLKKSYPYTGKAIKPSIRVYKGSRRLTEGTDYTLSYKNNKNVGINACISINFKGNLSGTENMSFEIEKNPLKNVSYEEDGLVVSYKAGGKHNNIRPVLTMNGVRLKYSDKDFEYIYIDAKTRQKSDCIDVGDYIVSMGAKTTSRGYTGFIEVPFTVTDKPAMCDVTVTPSKKSLPYNGTKQIPEFSLKHNGQTLNNSAYKMLTVSGDDYTEPGNHTVIFKGNGTDLIGSRSFTYKITGKRSLADSGVTAVIAPADLDKDGKVPYAYGGAKPKVVITYNGKRLKEKTDYTLSYKDNKKAGQPAKVTAKGKGNYKGSKVLHFTVSQRDLSSMLLTVNDRAESRTTGDYMKNPILFTDTDYKDQKLKKGIDYTAEFTVSSGNAKPVPGDTVTVNIEAKPGGKYKGKASASFKIIEKSKDISRAKVKVNKNKAYPYTGSAVKPVPADIEITLDGKPLSASDYDIVSYYNNINRGKSAVLIISGKGNLCGSKAVKFKIGAASVRKNWDGPVIFRYLIYNR
ncbi:MAG: InlB B-repeat-containing protein [Lachnospiraceae bacterium]|nr:InlB B-repeat-containing protein [Lachnospiraceae bacterium]